ncbi:MAG: Lpg1974 family pore-forming outer membrane protein [Pseudomonadota bacterium]
MTSLACGASAGSLSDSETGDPVVISGERIAQSRCITRGLQLRGGLLETDNVWEDSASTLPALSKLGYGDESGYLAEARLTCNLTGSRDITVGAGLHDVDFSESINVGVGNDPTISDDVSFQHLDIEFGWNRNANTTNLRAFVGMRALNYDSSSTANPDVLGAIPIEFSSSFLGIGPRIGAGFNTPLGEGRFGIFGEASAAAMIGAKEETLDGALQNSASETEMVVDLEAELGVGYSISPRSRISAGVFVKQLQDIDWVSGQSSDFNTQNTGSRMFRGAFIGFETEF